MPKQLHVSNLSPTVDESDLARLFASHGTVRRVEVFPSSPAGAASATGRVDMASDAEGDAAIERLDGRAYCGRLLAVGWATPRQVAGGGDAPLFDSMNMAEESVPLVSHGAAPVDFGDRPGVAGTGACRPRPGRKALRRRSRLAMAFISSPRICSASPSDPAPHRIRRSGHNKTARAAVVRRLLA